MAAVAQITDIGADALRRFFAWWLAELRGLLPWQLGARAEHAPAILDVSPDRVRLVLAKRGSAPALELPLGSDDPVEERGRVRSAMRARRLGEAVVIRLDEAVLLRSSLSLPLAAEHSLRPILQNQLERLVPLPSAEVCFEHAVISRSPAAKTLTVEVAIARRATIEDAVRLAKSRGLAPRLAIAAAGPAGRNAPMVLWLASRDENEAAGQRRLKRGLEIAAALLLIVAYVGYVYRLDGRRDELQAEVARLGKEAAPARTLVQQEAATRGALTLLERRRNEPSPLAMLNELTALLPTSTWVSQFNLNKHNIEIIGYSRRVSDFVPRINNSDSFWNLKFRSPIAASPDGKGERFDISFDVWVEDTP